jgi:hypothetical protein
VQNPHDTNEPQPASCIAIERSRVESTAIASLGYEAQHQILEIEFSSGTVYQYFDVPPDVYGQFLTAGSKGVWFNQAIRSRFSYAAAHDGKALGE